MKHFARLALEGISAEVLVFLLDFAEAGQNSVHLIDAQWVSHGVLQGFQFVMKITEPAAAGDRFVRSEEHTSELQSQSNLVCRLLLEKKKTKDHYYTPVSCYL